MEGAMKKPKQKKRVILFQDRFAPLVLDGTKPHTIRRQANCQPGDLLSLRLWTGKPRRKGSKQEVLREETCVAVLPVSIGHGPHGYGLRVDGVELIAVEARGKLARNDGFSCATQMRDWFKSTHGLPFEGFLIAWREVEL
jgi:hypothetical protein